MKFKIIAFSISIIMFIEGNDVFSKNVSGFYVTNEGDTVYSTLVIDNLMSLYEKIEVIDSLNNKMTFYPLDIKSFGFIALQEELESNYDIQYSSPFLRDEILKQGIIPKKKSFSLDGEIFVQLVPLHVYVFERFHITPNDAIFLRVVFGIGQTLKGLEYLLKIRSDDPFPTSIWFLSKNDQIVKGNGRTLKQVLLECVSDYHLLADNIQKDRIKGFPYGLGLPISAYNYWLSLNDSVRSDTCYVLKGFLDAEKKFNSGKYFGITCATGVGFFLPGMFTAVYLNHVIKFNDIKVPYYSDVGDMNAYKFGYIHRAYEMKYRASGRGALTGGVLSVLLIVLLSM
jgi:hypothetical protein